MREIDWKRQFVEDASRLIGAVYDPDDMEQIELSMSNCFHEIDPGLAEALLASPGKVCAKYSAWDFHGLVYAVPEMPGVFACRVKRYKVVMETITASTLEEIMQKVSDKYGWD
jgi:hypothetical protein